MTDRDISRLKEQYAQQTERWNELKARFAALAPEQELRIPAEFLEDLAALGTGARRVRPLPRFGVRV
jgi:hypothetical protein